MSVWDDFIMGPEFLVGEEVKDVLKVVRSNIDKVWQSLGREIEEEIVDMWEYALRCARYETLRPIIDLLNKFEADAQEDPSSALSYAQAATRLRGAINDATKDGGEQPYQPDTQAHTGGEQG